MTFRILSPDGFDIECDTQYHGEADVSEALERFVERYRFQGYYSTSNRERIPLREIADYCTVIETQFFRPALCGVQERGR